MNNLLIIVYIALFTYQASTAPRPKRDHLEEIITELDHLNNTLHSVHQEYEQIQMLHSEPQKKRLSIEDISCRAIHSFEALKNTKTNIKKIVKLLHYIKSPEVNCTQFPHHNENTEDMRIFIENLLKEFRKHNLSN
ncbi:uncharacterized protein ACNLHF_015283 [Anomaloglossus baeobatrachus]